MARMRVLIVGDQDLQHLLVAILQEIGTTDIARALDGGAAMTHLARISGRIDLVICALDLPNANGLEVLKFLRGKYGNKPFLLLAATATGETIAAAQSLGVSGFIAIPFSVVVLKKRVTAIAAAWQNPPATGAAPGKDGDEVSEEDFWYI
jgi:CheY-like chemotaxis protein